MSAPRTYVRWLEELGNGDVPLVGGKNASLGELIRALEEKENLVRLLTECLTGAENALQVVVGLPRPPLLRNFALIGNSFELPGGLYGHMAVLGPARMPYERAIRAMGFIGKLLHSQTPN